MSGVLRRPGLTLAVLCFAQGMILLDVTIVNVALPSIQHDLGVSPGALEWVVGAYALALATLIPFGGALGDRYGRRRFFLAGLALFTLASALCALSTVDVELICFRVLQGVGGAAMSALTLSILVETYPAPKRAAAIGTWAAIAGLGFGAGPVVGGLLLGVFGWSSVFWVNVPLGLLALLLGLVAVPDSRDPRPRPLDLAGGALSAAGLFSVTFALTESTSSGWSSPAVLGLLSAGVVLLVVFYVAEHRVAEPMLPPALVHQRVFRTTNAVYFFGYLALTGMFFYVTLYEQNLHGWSALRTGLSWLAMNLPFLAVAQGAGRLALRFSRRGIIVTGAVLGGLSVVGLAQVTVHTPYWVLALCYVALGLGYGLFVPAGSTAAMADIPEGVSGVASGVLNTSRQLGASVGLAVLGSIGATTVLHRWATATAGLPADQQATARSLSSDVAGGQTAAVSSRLGPAAAHQAADAFMSGYRLALTVAGLTMLGAAVLAAVGLRSETHPDQAEHALAPAPARAA